MMYIIFGVLAGMVVIAFGAYAEPTFLQCDVVTVNNTPTFANCTSFAPQVCGFPTLDNVYSRINATAELVDSLNATLDSEFIGACMSSVGKAATFQRLYNEVLLEFGNESDKFLMHQECLAENSRLDANITILASQASVCGENLNREKSNFTNINSLVVGALAGGLAVGLTRYAGTAQGILDRRRGRG